MPKKNQPGAGTPRSSAADPFGMTELGANRLAKARLAKSGLTLQDAVKLGIRAMTVNEVEAHKVWGDDLSVASLEFAYYDLNGSRIMDRKGPFARFRRLIDPDPLPTDYRKYVQPPYTAPHAYFVRHFVDWNGVKADPTQLIVFTEGELKSACACKNGFVTIGLGGIWSFRSKKRGIAFLEELEAFACKNRNAVLVFDSDPGEQTNKDVAQALTVFGRELQKRGVRVRMIVLPTLTPGEKTGLDDFIVARGRDEFAKLLESATEEVAGLLPPWTVDFQTGASGPLNTLANAQLVLRNAAELSGCIAYDEMARQVSIMKVLPGMKAEDNWPRRLSDVDVLHIQAWIQRHGYLRTIGREVVRDAVNAVAREHAFHPLRDELDALVWDGVPRLDGWLRDYLGAQGESEYLAVSGRKFLISTVARVYEPGCQCDYTLVLEGPQGIGKSSVCKILGGRWAGDNLPDLAKSAEVSFYIRDKWIIEVSELAAIKKADIETLNSYFTRPVEDYRPPYGHERVREPRQCVHIGTTNSASYLRDETGARRSWPAKLKEMIDLAKLREIRGQLLAEAVARYKAGETWHPDTKLEERLFKPVQDDRYEEDAWQGTIMAWIEDGCLFGAMSVDVTISNVARHALNSTDIIKLGTNETRRISGVLRRLGWEAKRMAAGMVWFPGPSAKVLPPKPGGSETTVVPAQKLRAARRKRRVKF